MTESKQPSPYGVKGQPPRGAKDLAAGGINPFGNGKDGGSDEDRPRKSRWMLGLKIFAGLTALGLVAVVGVGIYAAIYTYKLSKDLPPYTELRNYQPKVMTRIHAGDGSLLAEYAVERRIFVPIESIPPKVVHAFISAEDKNFYSHGGIDYQGLLRAALVSVKNYATGRRLVGGSTITQQVAKNFLLSGEQKIERKVKEALLARRIESAFTKDQILELYLNEIYIGWGSYGVAAAALNYFDKSLDELSIAEAAYLAAVIKGPANYRPDRETTRQRGIDRRNWVIGRMAANGWISDMDAELAQREELVVYDRPFGSRTVEGEYFAEEVRRRVAELYGEDSLYDGGLSVRTTIEPKLQKVAMKALRKGLQEYDRRHGWRGPLSRLEEGADWTTAIKKVDFATDLAPWQGAVVLEINDEAQSVTIGLQDGEQTGTIPLEELTWARKALEDGKLGEEITLPSQVLALGDIIYVEPIWKGGAVAHFALRQIPKVNGGIVAMDPHTGRVLAMIGGYSFEQSQFNRAVQAKRQPGSAFKPVVYAAALDNGYTPSSILNDAPLVEEQGLGMGKWKPKNFVAKFYGPRTLRWSIEKSLNLATVRLARDVGLETVLSNAEQLGVYDQVRRLPSMAVGAGETTLLRMTTAYSMFVNGGKRVEPIFIDQIQDRMGRAVYRKDRRICEGCNTESWNDVTTMPLLPDTRDQVMDEHTAYQVTSLLEGVVKRGTGRKIREVGKPLAGKTGTTDYEKDAWFVGFSPDLAVGVYVGFDIPRSLGKHETGGSLAAPIFRDFMGDALRDTPAIPFRVPPGMTLIRVNSLTGQVASAEDDNVIIEAFKPGSGPDAEAFRRLVGEADDIGVGSDQRVRRGTGGLY